MIHQTLICLFLSLFLSLFLQPIVYAAIATFSVENTGISGSVIINDRTVIVNLDLSQVNISRLPNSTCFTEGARYHIHTKWAYNDTKDRIGQKDCGSTYTGSHWDPWIACSSSTGNKYCLSYSSSSSYKCVNSSSAYKNNGSYTCSSTIYNKNPFACEVGDFDGKYGRLYLENNMFARKDTSFWEVKSSDVQLKSIVFHCGATNQRAFCAPFNSASDTSNNTLTQSESSMTATFDDLDSKITLKNDGSYEVDVNLTSIQSNLNCQNIAYRIYNSWNGSESSYVGDTECASIVGKVYDPTITCLNNTDSEYCYNNEVCNDPTYAYNCSNSDSRYTCAPSDLSGKYGKLETNNFAILKFFKTGTDDLMIPMELMEGKSVVLECADYSTKIACAKFIGESDANNNSNSGLSKTDVILIAVFTIVGVVIISLGGYWFWRNRTILKHTDEERTPLTQKAPL